MNKFLLILCIIALFACSDQKPDQYKVNVAETSSKIFKSNQKASLVNKIGKTIQERFLPPSGFERLAVNQSSFAYFLRNFNLKPDGSEVYYYNGQAKHNEVHAAVLDIDAGENDLQQCADAVMRLRAEHLYQQKAFDRIHFNFTNGFRCDYNKWKVGNRIKIKGNKTWWAMSSKPDNSYASFRKYMDQVYMYAGTASLEKELKSVAIENMKIGDVFIIGGFPGHAVIVVDMVENRKTKEKLFMLAQSYMPAQDIHVLLNPNDTQLSPWYSLNFGETLKTPEWTFSSKDLKRFE